MNSNQKPDEIKLWNLFGPGKPFTRIDFAGAALGIPPKRVLYLAEKWISQGRLEYHAFAWLAKKHFYSINETAPFEANAYKNCYLCKETIWKHFHFVTTDVIVTNIHGDEVSIRAFHRKPCKVLYDMARLSIRSKD